MLTSVEDACSDALFNMFQRVISERVGIHLGRNRKPLLVGRLAGRIRDLELRDFHSYYRLVLDDDAEWIEMVDRIVTNETAWFRERQHWQRLASDVYPEWRDARRARIRAWSAACSTGQEPYSLAMHMSIHDVATHCEVSIDASDISSRALRTAGRGIYPITQLTEIPKSLHERFLLRGRGPDHGTFRVQSAIRSLIAFSNVNLVRLDALDSDPYDLILCRNVLIYFEASVRERVVRSLTDRLAPGGRLLLGHAETLPRSVTGMAVEAPAVYRKVS